MRLLDGSFVSNIFFYTSGLQENSYNVKQRKTKLISVYGVLMCIRF